MKIGLAQIDIEAGRPEKNVPKILDFIDRAKGAGCDIVAAPEMSVGGYLVGDLWTDYEWCEYCMSFDDILQRESSGIVLVYGNVWMDTQNELKCNEAGLPVKFNVSRIFHNREMVYRPNAWLNYFQAKLLLPNYRYFHDKRYFTSGIWIAPDYPTSPFPVEIKGKQIKLGLELCEDMWDTDYDISPTGLLADQDADVIINISASPWTYNKNRKRDKVVENVINWHNDGPVFCYVNCVGAQNTGKNILTFDGASTVYGKDGKPRILGNSQYREELIIVDTENLPNNPIERIQRPSIQEKYDASVRGTQHMLELTGAKKVINAISGGVDSAVSTAILYGAMGKERSEKDLILINLPSRYNSKETKTYAFRVARHLGLRYIVQDIEPIEREVHNALSQMSIGWEEKLLQGVVKENIQAKVRMTDLASNFAQMMGGIFVNNGNKTELATGYFTLYGDGGGAFCVLADLIKEDVFDMGHHINDRYKREIVPEELLPDKLYQFGKGKKKPTAELKDNQEDWFLHGYHGPLLNMFMDYRKQGVKDVLQWFIEKRLAKVLGIDKKILEIYNLNDPQVFIADLERFTGAIKNSVFKRKQTPPLITLTKTSFGDDLQESILPKLKWGKKAREIKNQILQK